MADQELREALNDCIDRMAAGQSIGDCLRRYPQYAALLQPMLEIGSLVERSQPNPLETAEAQARVRARIRQRAIAPRPQRSYSRLALLAASLLIAFAAVFAAAENSLPGDALYGVKRFEEGARGFVSGASFADRRVDEIRVLLALKREADVEFSGTVEAMDGIHWQVAGLDLLVPLNTEGAQAARVGDSVQVRARTTAQGDLVAQAITLLRKAEPTPQIAATITVSSTRTPTSEPSETPTSTETPVPSATPTATLTATDKPSATPTATLTATDNPSATPTLTHTALPPSATPTPTTCTPTMPPGWTRYVIQSGDTVAGLAALSGTTAARLIEVNCLPQNLMIIVGQPLFLPALPPSATSQPIQAQAPTAAPASQPTDDSGHHGGDDSSGSGSNNSGSGSSGDGSSGDSHGGSGSDG